MEKRAKREKERETAATCLLVPLFLFVLLRKGERRAAFFLAALSLCSPLARRVEKQAEYSVEAMVEVERTRFRSLFLLACSFFFLEMPQVSEEPPSAPLTSFSPSFRCPKCRRAAQSNLNHSPLELDSDGNPCFRSSSCCCSICGFVFDPVAIEGGNWRSRPSVYLGGSFHAESIVTIAGSFTGNAATGNWVSNDGTAAGKTSE